MADAPQTTDHVSYNAGLEAAAKVALRVYQANSASVQPIYEDQIRAQIAMEISKRIVALKEPALAE